MIAGVLEILRRIQFTGSLSFSNAFAHRVKAGTDTAVSAGAAVIERERGRSEAGSLLLWLVPSVLSFVLLCFFLFNQNEAFLFHGLDGSYMRVISKQQLTWTSLELGFGSNFMQGLGNIWFSLNTRLTLGYVASTLPSDGTTGAVVAYGIFAVELFLATLIAAWCCKFTWPTSLIAGWSLTLLVFPFLGLPAIYPVMALIPHLATVITASTIAIAGLLQIGRRGPVHSALMALLVLLDIFYVAVAQPLTLVLVAPILIVFGTVDIIRSGSRKVLATKMIGLTIILAMLAVSGTFTYAYGLLKYTASYFFPQDFQNARMSLHFASILFHSDWGAWLIGISACGMISTLILGDKRARTVALAAAVYALGILVFGLLSARFDFWRGPSPLYFEFLLWPFYAAFAAHAIGLVATWFGALAAARASRFRSALNKVRSLHRTVAIAVLPWVLLTPVGILHSPGVRFHPYPPPTSDIIERLKKDIALTPGSPFRGRVATFTGWNLGPAASWLDLHSLDYQVIKKLGNDHRMVGLWFYDLPTLLEYNSLLTPSFHAFAMRFLALAGDRQLRSAMTLRNPDPSILTALGVKFVITDLPWPGQTLRSEISLADLGALYLYELRAPNTSNYSPVRVHRANSLRQTFKILGQPGMDFSRDIVLGENISENLVPANASELVADRGQLRLRARSDGTSLILLPVEFSHCLDLVVGGQSAFRPRIMRANLVQAAVLFDRTADATIQYFTGPFLNASCRLRDADDMLALLRARSD